MSSTRSDRPYAMTAVAAVAMTIWGMGQALGQATDVDCVGCVDSGDIASEAVITGKLAPGAVTSAKIRAGAVDAPRLSGGAVTTEKIRNGAVRPGKLADGAVITDKIRDGAVTEAKLGDGAVTATKLGAAAVTDASLADGAVTATKLGDGAVTDTKLADGAVTAAKLAADAVAGAAIVDGAVTETKIVDGAVTSAKLGDAAVTDTKLADGAVTAAKLAADAVAGTALADGAVTAAKLDPALPGAGLAIDGTELRLADGFVSVSAEASQAQDALFLTNSDTQDGRRGRVATTAASQLLVAPVQLPHGATVTSFTYTVFDNELVLDSTAELVRDDGASLASVVSSGNTATVVTIVDAVIDNAVVDSSQFSYLVLMQVHGQGSDNGRDIMPVNAIIAYTY